MAAAPRQEHEGSGTLSAVAYIRRTETKGGVAPGAGCDASHLSEQARTRYSATYQFFSPGKPKTIRSRPTVSPTLLLPYHALGRAAADYIAKPFPFSAPVPPAPRLRACPNNRARRGLALGSEIVAVWRLQPIRRRRCAARCRGVKCGLTKR